jgi:hypothetical protein
VIHFTCLPLLRITGSWAHRLRCLSTNLCIRSRLQACSSLLVESVLYAACATSLCTYFRWLVELIKSSVHVSTTVIDQFWFFSSSFSFSCNFYFFQFLFQFQFLHFSVLVSVSVKLRVIFQLFCNFSFSFSFTCFTVKCQRPLMTRLQWFVTYS